MSAYKVHRYYFCEFKHTNTVAKTNTFLTLNKETHNAN